MNHEPKGSAKSRNTAVDARAWGRVGGCLHKRREREAWDGGGWAVLEALILLLN